MLNNLRKEPIQDQLNALNEVVRDIFTILLQVPEMIEDQMNDLRAQVTILSGDLEHTRAQLKEIMRVALPAPAVPPPAPKSNGEKGPYLAGPLTTSAPPTTTQAAGPPVPGRPATVPQKPNVHAMVMRELKEMLDRRRKYAESESDSEDQEA